jgi:hypothetical protein
MGTPCRFSTAGGPFLFSLLRSDLDPSALRFSLSPTAQLLTASGLSPIRLEAIDVSFSQPSPQIDDEGEPVLSLHFTGQCQLELPEALAALPPDAELDYDLALALPNGEQLIEGKDWAFVECDTLHLQ